MINTTILHFKTNHYDKRISVNVQMNANNFEAPFN